MAETTFFRSIGLPEHYFWQDLKQKFQIKVSQINQRNSVNIAEPALGPKFFEQQQY